MKVKYIGAKHEMPVYEPIGKKPRASSKIAHVLKQGEELELNDEQAKDLVSLDGGNFELVGAPKKEKVVEKVVEEVVVEKPKAKKPLLSRKHK